LKRNLGLLTLSLAVLGACQRAPKADSPSIPTASGPVPAGTPPPATPPADSPIPILNPVLPGDYADPSVTTVGNTYWASATSSNWGPIFPLLTSKNLLEWKLVGHVFPDKGPAWADYYFWAPEISQEGKKTYVYYTAHKKNGPLCVGIASADNPAGPYTDHGPLVGQAAGSIDGFPMRDEKGQLYLLWKEDGNSRNEPTPIWAQRLNEEHTALVGERKELFRNDKTWEGNLVEGVAMERHGDYFYAFYAGNGCCGGTCTYALGVARSRNLLGPWEKYERNPVLVNSEYWKCPGHGTVVERNNHWYLLHHAYSATSGHYVGRQGILSEFSWGSDNWPVFSAGRTPGVAVKQATPPDVKDEFTGKTLDVAWQWPIEEKPQATVLGGKLRLTARPDHSGAALGHSTYTAAYTATTLLETSTLPVGTTAGLAALGDPDNTLALMASHNKLQLLQREKGKQKTLGEATLPATAKAVTLRLQATGGNQFRFEWSVDEGKTWQALPNATGSINGSYLPPWDRGVRVGVLAQGPTSATAVFERFELASQM
jgi:beta-xylosidase